MLVRHEFECAAVEIEATIKVRQLLAIVLSPDNGPLREEIRRVGMSSVVRHRPGQELSRGIRGDGPVGSAVEVTGKDCWPLATDAHSKTANQFR